MKLDNTNLRLLDLLQQDARTTFSNLARALNRAESTIRERIMMMEQRGVIRAYRAVVDEAKLGFPIRAQVEIECDMSTIPALTQKLKTIPNVVRASVMTGGSPICIEVVAEDLLTLEKLVEKHLANVGVKRTSVRLVLQTLVEERPGPLVTAAPLPLASTPLRETRLPPVRYVAPAQQEQALTTPSGRPPL